MNEIRHFILPDCQVKPDVPLEHLTWAAKYCAEKKPSAIICLGDFADMESLSEYDVGRKCFEGRRYVRDIEVAKDAMSMFMRPIREEQEKLKRNKEKQWKPKLLLLLGNHENRVDRAIDKDAKLDGLISTKDLEYERFGWEVQPFLKVIVQDEIAYSHYFVSGIMGRPVTSARMLLTKHHMSCIAGHQQGRDIAYGKRADGSSITGLISGCLTPDHKVLTADLRYVPIGDLKVGDKLVSFSEQPERRRRRFETGILEKVARDIDDVWEVTLQSGKKFKVTKDHQWLAKTGSLYFWRTTESLRIGTQIPKLLDEWDFNDSYDAGWLAGIYDGEGSLYARRTTGGHVMQLSISQKSGIVFDKIKRVITEVTGRTSNNWCVHDDVNQLRINGGAPQIAKVLGEIRPERLLDKFKPEYLGNISCSDSRNDKVVSKVYLGKREIVRSKVDKGTYIAEGYGHHNSFYQHTENYLNAQTNEHWHGVWLLNDIQRGAFDELPISLNYLKERYGTK